MGKLLVNRMLKDQGITPSSVQFQTTQQGKPYLVRHFICSWSQLSDQSPQILPPEISALAYNITHDNGIIALAFDTQPGSSIGVDVMKVAVPRNEKFDDFVEAMEDQLTSYELGLLKDVDEAERLKRFFWMWTLKEAYTKALGIGLGFDFKRVEFRVPTKQVYVDGVPLKSWIFNMVTIDVAGENYQLVVAEHKVDGETRIVEHTSSPDWLSCFAANTIAQDALL